MNSSKRLTGQVLFYGVVVIVTVLCLFPIIFTLLTSFKPNREMYLYPPTILPKTWTLEAYISILSKKKYLLHFFNAWVISTLCHNCLYNPGGLSRLWIFEVPAPCQTPPDAEYFGLTNVSWGCPDDSVFPIGANPTPL